MPALRDKHLRAHVPPAVQDLRSHDLRPARPRALCCILRDVLRTSTPWPTCRASPSFPSSVVEQVLTEAGRFCAEVLASLNAPWRQGRLRRARPSKLDEYPAGVQGGLGWQLTAGGWTGLSSSSAYGGQELPSVLALAFSEMSSSANMAFSMYPGLTYQPHSAILAGGSEAQKELYLPQARQRRVDRDHEPHRAAMRHRPWPHPRQAVPAADGSYRITGEKIWISAGEHDLAANIVSTWSSRSHRGGPGWHARHQPLHRSEVPPRRGGQARRPQRPFLHRPGREDGHPRQRHLLHADYEGATGWLVGEEEFAAFP